MEFDGEGVVIWEEEADTDGFNDCHYGTCVHDHGDGYNHRYEEVRGVECDDVPEGLESATLSSLVCVECRVYDVLVV